MKVACLVVLLAAVGAAVAEIPETMTRYDNFKLYRITVDDNAQLAQLKSLSESVPIRFLNEPGRVPSSYDIVVHPDNKSMLETVLNHNSLHFECISEDMQKLIDIQMPVASKSKLEWTRYHHLEDIYQWIYNLSWRKARFIRPYLVGLSWELRPIWGMKLSRQKGNKAIFIESSIHAIEWISSAAATCFFDSLVYSKDPKIQELSKNYDWIFVPVANPDGFDYTHNVDRLWRKNRQQTGYRNSSGPCFGTDLNRNFDYMWKEVGYNVDVPCDHWYAGRSPGSAVEVKALQKFVSSFHKDYIRVYLAIHSYGNYLLLPYGHTTEEFPPNYDQMMRISKGFADAAVEKYNTTFLYGSSGLLMNPVSGSAKDWAYGVKHINYTATVELRDNGTYGFYLPPSQIIEVCDELTDGIVGLVKAAAEEKLFD